MYVININIISCLRVETGVNKEATAIIDGGI